MSLHKNLVAKSLLVTGTFSTSFYLEIANISPASAGTCEVQAVRSVPGQNSITRWLTATASNTSDCQSNLNDQQLFWCRTFPDEGGAHCYQDSSTATFSGFSTPSSQDNRQGSCATFFWDGDFTNNRYEVESGARIGFIGNRHNDEFSSAIVQPGFRVRAFESRDFQGRELRLDSQPQYGRADFTPRADGAMGFGYFPREMNDKVSSIICERASSPPLTFSQTIREVTALPSARNDFVQDGFYRVNAAGAVWQLYTENGTPKACGIASGEHLANLGGEGRVSVLSDIGTGRTWTGTCSIADGFYRVNAAGVVWQLYTENGTSMACGIASGEHLARRGGANRVRTVPSGAEAGAQRNWAGTCPI